MSELSVRSRLQRWFRASEHSASSISIFGLNIERGVAVLWVAGVCSEAIYLVALTQPYWLLRYYNYAHLDIGKITEHTQAPMFFFVLAFAALFVAYGIGYWRARADDEGRWAPLVIQFGAFFAVALALMYPITALDLFDYIAEGRVLVAHGANPMVIAPSAYPHDPVLPYAAWPMLTSFYGPLWYWLSAIPSLVGGDDLLRNVLAIKAIITAFHLANIVLIWQTLKILRTKFATAGTLLYAWNPLVLFEGPGNGHNDIVMMTFVLLAVYLAARGNWVWVIPALVASALVKYVTLLIVPAFLWWLIAGRRGDLALFPGNTLLRARILFAAKTLALSAAIVMVTLAPFWEGAKTFEGLRAYEDMLAGSPTAYAAALLAPSLDGQVQDAEQAARVWVRLAGLIPFAAIALWQTGRARAGWQAVLRAAYVIIFAYLLFLNMWFHPWYILWLLALVPLIDDRAYALHAIVFAISGLITYTAFLWFVDWNNTSLLDRLRVDMLSWLAPVPLFIWLLIDQPTRERILFRLARVRVEQTSMSAERKI